MIKLPGLAAMRRMRSRLNRQTQFAIPSKVLIQKICKELPLVPRRALTLVKFYRTIGGGGAATQNLKHVLENFIKEHFDRNGTPNNSNPAGL